MGTGRTGSKFITKFINQQIPTYNAVHESLFDRIKIKSSLHLTLKSYFTNIKSTNHVESNPAFLEYLSLKFNVDINTLIHHIKPFCKELKLLLFYRDPLNYLNSLGGIDKWLWKWDKYKSFNNIYKYDKRQWNNHNSHTKIVKAWAIKNEYFLNVKHPFRIYCYEEIFSCPHIFKKMLYSINPKEISIDIIQNKMKKIINKHHRSKNIKTKVSGELYSTTLKKLENGI